MNATFTQSITDAVATVTAQVVTFMQATVFIPIRLIMAYWQFVLIAGLIIAGIALAKRFGIVRF